VSQATWPEVEKPRPRNFGQSRGGAPRGERARSGRSAQTDGPWRALRPKRERVATAVGVARPIFSLRLPALRLPSFYLEAKHQWPSLLLQNSGADAPRGRFFTSSLPGLTRQSMARCRSFVSPFVSMDHRVKPGGDEGRSDRPQRSGGGGAPSPHPLPARGEREPRASRSLFHRLPPSLGWIKEKGTRRARVLCSINF